jgi:hypothetical protein
VDALLGRVTRAHKDLDLLVLVSDLSQYPAIVERHWFDDGGAVVQFHKDPWSLHPDTVTGRGTVEAMTLRCVSRAATQLSRQR